jgi:hypothetical protein
MSQVYQIQRQWKSRRFQKRFPVHLETVDVLVLLLLDELKWLQERRENQD